MRAFSSPDRVSADASPLPVESGDPDTRHLGETWNNA